MKYYLIAGEASGDMHTANLMSEIKKNDNDAKLRYWGGDKMKSVGGTLVKHYKDTAIMGFKDVLLNLGKIKENIKTCRNDILAYQPDVLILTDYAGFNLKIAKFAKSKNINVIWYIPPKVWAWRKYRIKSLKAYTDKVMTIFPFEKSFFKENGMEVDFVGNPLLDAIEKHNKQISDNEDFVKQNHFGDKPIIALLPGSRVSELKYHLPVFSQLPAKYPDYQFVIAGAPALDYEVYQKYLADKNIKVIFNQTYDILNHAKAAVVASGTATLETAFFKVPQVCCYKGDNFSYQIAKRLVKLKFVSLVNLIANDFVIKELLYEEMTLENIKNELDKLLNDKQYIEKMSDNYEQIRVKSGGVGASKRAADLVANFLKNKAKP